jgi:hypothetical protein
MSDVTMTAAKAIYIRPAGRVEPGQTFTVSEARAAELEQRGFAERTEGGAKAEDAPLNKAEPLPLNKTDEGPKRRRRTKADDAE